MAKGFVYFCGYSKEVKIGKSKRTPKRMRELNGANPNEVQLYAEVVSFNMDELERRLHEHFKYCRKPGKREWYALNMELQYLIIGLQAIKYPTDLDVGMILGEFKARLNPIADNPTLYRHTRSLELSQQELWALSYAVRSLGMHNYPIFHERYMDAKMLVSKLLDGQVPMFIRKGNEPLKLAIAEIEPPMPAPHLIEAIDEAA